MKRAVASKNSRSGRVSGLKSTKSQQSAKVLKLKLPKKRQITARNMLLVGLLVALFLWSIYPLKQRAEQQRANRLLREKIDESKGKNQELGEEVDRLKSYEYVELVARREFGLVKPGETSVWVIPAEENDSKDNKLQAEDKKEQKDKADAVKKDSKQSKSENEAAKKGSKNKTGSSKSWWQRGLSFLDRLTGSKNR